jgi:hypothetical protein
VVGGHLGKEPTFVGVGGALGQDRPRSRLGQAGPYGGKHRRELRGADSLPEVGRDDVRPAWLPVNRPHDHVEVWRVLPAQLGAALAGQRVDQRLVPGRARLTVHPTSVGARAEPPSRTRRRAAGPAKPYCSGSRPGAGLPLAWSRRRSRISVSRSSDVTAGADSVWFSCFFMRALIVLYGITTSQ